MTNEDLNGYVDYRQLYSDIRKSHLEAYPNVETFIKDYIQEDINETQLKTIQEMYNFIIRFDENLITKTFDVWYDQCIINTENNVLTIAFVDDNSTNTESGYDASYSGFIFDVDLECDCFKQYTFDH